TIGIGRTAHRGRSWWAMTSTSPSIVKTPRDPVNRRLSWRRARGSRRSPRNAVRCRRGWEEDRRRHLLPERGPDLQRPGLGPAHREGGPPGAMRLVFDLGTPGWRVPLLAREADFLAREHHAGPDFLLLGAGPQAVPRVRQILVGRGCCRRIEDAAHQPRRSG